MYIETTHYGTLARILYQRKLGIEGGATRIFIAKYLDRSYFRYLKKR